MSNLSLIRSWHEKAKEDYFSSYIFEYLAFEAYLKKYKYTQDEIRRISGNTKERSYIQMIKNEKAYSRKWAYLIDADTDLRTRLESLRGYLQEEPLLESGNWWGCNAYGFHDCPEPVNPGMLDNINNFGEVVEFWYYVRNNLFHASKDPNDERDERLVTHAYLSLSVFMDKALLPEMEQRIMVPAQWEEFSHKFFTGQAEAQVTINGATATANIYELLYVEDEVLPIFFDGQMIDRDYIISKLSFNLINLAGDESLCKKEWGSIISRAKNDEQKARVLEYFSDTITTVKTLVPDIVEE